MTLDDQIPVGELEIRQPLKQRVNRNSPFHSCQACPKTKVMTHPKCDVIRLTIDPNFIREVDIDAAHIREIIFPWDLGLRVSANHPFSRCLIDTVGHNHPLPL